MESYICITGATGGLGKAFAAECAGRGYDLFLTDLYEVSLSRLAEGLRNAYGIKVVCRACDLTDYRSRSELFSFLEESSIKFWGLINVAGLDYEGLFAERTSEEIRTMLKLNIEANLDMTFGVLKLRDTGSIFRVINVASLAAFYPMPVKAVYAASKRFVLDFSLALREEIRSSGCTVTALCPAGMPTKESCIKAIEAQGFMGMITTMNVGYVAAKTLDSALKGRAIVIPGTVNQVLRFLGGIVPKLIVARLIGIRWISARKREEKAA